MSATYKKDIDPELTQLVLDYQKDQASIKNDKSIDELMSGMNLKLKRKKKKGALERAEQFRSNDLSDLMERATLNGGAKCYKCDKYDVS
jgi:predicted peroxiredoxin